MSEKVRITPEVLHWGRTTAGYTPKAAAAEFGQKIITPQRILDWENGNDFPSYLQLEKLSKIYQRPIVIFFAPAPPEEDPLEKIFQSLPAEYVKKIPPKMRFAIRSAQLRQINLTESRDGALPRAFDWWMREKPASLNIQDIPQIAKKIRERLGVSLEEQRTDWKKPREALSKWREKVENLGALVFKESFGGKEYGSFFLPDDHFPVVCLNEQDKKLGRQIFTLFRELGHILLQKGGVSLRRDLEGELDGEYKKEEVFCNAFAGELLVPDESFQITDARNDGEIRRLAGSYKVSEEVILRKYHTKGFISSEEYNRKINELAHPSKTASVGAKTADMAPPAEALEMPRKRKISRPPPDLYTAKKSKFGDKFLKLAFSRYSEQRISESELAEYLEVKESDLPELKAAVYKK